jgi:hypothetical protein
MNKRSLFKYILICITTILSVYFLITEKNIGFGILPMIIPFMFAIAVFMFSKKEKVKKFRFIYNVVLLLLMIFAIGLSLHIILNEIKYFIDHSCCANSMSIFVIIYLMLLFNLLLFCISDIFNKTDKVNDILTIVVSLIIILIHIRYYLDPHFIYRIIEGNEYLIYSNNYITQNYIYFIIMYAVVFLHRKFNY